MSNLVSEYHEQSADFLLKQYEGLRKEVEILIQESRALERNIALTVGAIWVWLLGKTPALPWWTFVTPVLFSALGAFRAYGIHRAFADLSKFMRVVERAFLGEQCKDLAWNFAEPKGGISDSRGALLFWLFLNLCTVGMVILRSFNLP